MEECMVCGIEFEADQEDGMHLCERCKKEFKEE